MTAVAVAGLIMLAVAVAFSPDDPSASSAWGTYDLVSIAIAVLFAVAAPVVAVIAVVRKERAVTVYLSVLPFLLIFLHPLFMND